MKRWIIATALLAFASTGFPAVTDCQNCGTVRNVDVMTKSGQASGGGAVIGAVIGGVIGHQFGKGRGQDAATAAGAVGGAAAGHQVEKNKNTGQYYRITVDMDRGETREVNVNDPAGLRAGSRVRVSGNNLEKVSG